MKNLYKGIFNLSESVTIERVYANSERQAWLLFCIRIAKRKGVSPRQVMQLFSGVKDNYRVTKEFEFQEVENG